MGSSAELDGKTFLITGANIGIGRATTLELARRGARLLLACRSESKTVAVIEEAKRERPAADVSFIELDLSDLGSVKRCADRVLERETALHGLINNAGLASQRGISKDGFEIAFAVNHLGHFLLTKRLLPLLERGAASRIVNVSSRAHYRPKSIDWDALRRPTTTYLGMHEYGVSKLANVLFTRELARRLGDGGKVHAYALHPGVVASNIWQRIPWPARPLVKAFMVTNEEGAETSVYCATSPEVAAQTGRYYERCREVKPSKLAYDEDLARELWTRSEAWVAAFE
jgi:retinol dehydrogenase 12